MGSGEPYMHAVPAVRLDFIFISIIGIIHHNMINDDNNDDNNDNDNDTNNDNNNDNIIIIIIMIIIILILLLLLLLIIIMIIMIIMIIIIFNDDTNNIIIISSSINMINIQDGLAVGVSGFQGIVLMSIIAMAIVSKTSNTINNSLQGEPLV